MKSSGVGVDCSELKSQLNRLKEYHESSEECNPCSDKGVKRQALKVDFKPSFGPRAGRITNLHKPKVQEHQLYSVDLDSLNRTFADAVKLDHHLLRYQDYGIEKLEDFEVRDVLREVFLHNSWAREQYYLTQQQSSSLVHRFYQEESKLACPEDDGTMSTTTTLQAINEKILSLNCGQYRASITYVDTQESYNGGVHVLVLADSSQAFLKAAWIVFGFHFSVSNLGYRLPNVNRSKVAFQFHFEANS
ncbi:hypothetical protein RHMOL_Rhmol06G0136600 [Rhododendron molle]|uniref:Uncharacterized protein n=2 Tax=Rhododendron molle TaxID=49168 RepID=A0ACC0NC93_RHOML|nr:hypothetical protein RHMOL_Rhmol06G0136600 [Rhododendron molle]KAI8550811.1 hypothetical protein RHMOL_Rhmol06G0136600 [Rhododendron molle]